MRPPKPNPMIARLMNLLEARPVFLGLYRKGSGGLQAEQGAENRPDAAENGWSRTVPRRPAQRPADQLIDTALRVTNSPINPIIKSASVA